MVCSQAEWTLWGKEPQAVSLLSPHLPLSHIPISTKMEVMAVSSGY